MKKEKTRFDDLENRIEQNHHEVCWLIISVAVILALMFLLVIKIH